MSSEVFDREEARHQADELLALIENLRPHPKAILLSRAKVRLMAAISGDDLLIKFATLADENTLFWDVEGEIIEQRVSLMELPAAD